MKDPKTLNDFGISSSEFDEKITIREAYFAMFEFLESHWENALEYEISDVLSVMSLWQNTTGDKAPMDSSILPDFLAAVRKIKELKNEEKEYRGIDIKLKKK